MSRSDPQPRRKRRRRRSWPRTILLIVFVLAILAGIYACLVRKPQVKAAPAGSTSQDVSSSSSVSSEPEPVKERKDDFFTILVSGLDDEHGGSDTNILIGFDAKNQSITGVSIPRDTGVYINGHAYKINYAYNAGGTEKMRDTVADAMGVPVDFYVEVNIKAFVKLVDEIGGVDFEVPLNMNYDDPLQNLHIHLKMGMQHLDGQNALKVVRFRHNNDGSGYGTEDIGRIGTQQAFLKAVFKKMLANPQKLTSYVEIFSEYVKTDLATSELAWFGQQALLMGLDKLNFETLPGVWSERLKFWVVDQDAALELINNGLNPCTADRTLDDLHFVSD